MPLHLYPRTFMPPVPSPEGIGFLTKGGGF